MRNFASSATAIAGSGSTMQKGLQQALTNAYFIQARPALCTPRPHIRRLWLPVGRAMPPPSLLASAVRRRLTRLRPRAARGRLEAAAHGRRSDAARLARLGWTRRSSFARRAGSRARCDGRGAPQTLVSISYNPVGSGQGQKDLISGQPPAPNALRPP